jgi:DNA-binding LacI/PurR family transcriptional regulator
LEKIYDRTKDVAAYAGVSIAAVSYVVNNKPQKTISDETAVRVLNAARALTTRSMKKLSG